MAQRSIQASAFKARCLALLDEVARTREPVLVTKHGRPVARLVPVEEAPVTDGSVTLVADEDEAYFSTDEPWHVG